MGDFCTLRALEMAFLGRDYRRLHVWAVAPATAILGLHLAAATGHADIGATFYHSIAWNPVASIAGGWSSAMAWRWPEIAALAP